MVKIFDFVSISRIPTFIVGTGPYPAYNSALIKRCKIKIFFDNRTSMIGIILLYVELFKDYLTEFPFLNDVQKK